MSAFLFTRRGCMGVLTVAFWAVPFVAVLAHSLTFARERSLAEETAPATPARQAQVA